MKIPKVFLLALLPGLLLVYFISYMNWRKHHIMTFSEYSGTYMQLPEKIDKSDFNEIILPDINPEEEKLFNQVYVLDQTYKTFYLQDSSNIENHDKLFLIIEKAGYKDNTPVVIYISVNEYHNPKLRIYQPLINIDCRINNLSVVSE